MGTVRLRHALRADLPTIVDIWVDAFTDDPYFRWIAPNDDRRRTFLRAWLTLIVNLTFEHGHTFVGDPADVAIAWSPPDLELMTPDDLERARGIIAAHAGEARADESCATLECAYAHFLATPHWTLQYIGVRRANHGTGLGTAAVAPGLARCDHDGMSCSLMSSNVRNVPFYERLGFKVAAEAWTPDGATALRPMHRAARPSFTD